MAMYLAYDRDGNEALMRGRQVFSTHHGRWQTQDQFNSTLDGTKAYNLSKELGATLNSHLRSSIESGIVGKEALSMADSRGADRGVGTVVKPYSKAFLQTALDVANEIGFQPKTKKGMEVLAISQLPIASLNKQLRNHFVTLGITRSHQQKLDAGTQLRLAKTHFKNK